MAAARAEHAWLSGEEHRVAEEAAGVLELAVQAARPWLAGELAFWWPELGTGSRFLRPGGVLALP